MEMIGLDLHKRQWQLPDQCQADDMLYYMLCQKSLRPIETSSATETG